MNTSVGASDRHLDHPVWAALTSAHAAIAETEGRAARYPTEVAPFTAMDPDDDPLPWSDLAGLVGPGGIAVVTIGDRPPPPWEVLTVMDVIQMIGPNAGWSGDPEAVSLGPPDVTEMLDLVRRTEPGPFRPRTIELGSYLGFRQDGRLIAMAGERLRSGGWTEISAVCTEPDHQGRGLGARLVRAVGAGITARGQIPILHVAATNTGAIRLYEHLGFTIRRDFRFQVLRLGGRTRP
jgi:ribosomal protein S18 acetylase RimI-like enzyme